MSFSKNEIISGEAQKEQVIDFLIGQARRRMLLSSGREMDEKERVIEFKLSLISNLMAMGEYCPQVEWSTRSVERGMEVSRELFSKFWRQLGRESICIGEETAFWNLVRHEVYFKEWFSYVATAVEEMLVREKNLPESSYPRNVQLRMLGQEDEICVREVRPGVAIGVLNPGSYKSVGFMTMMERLFSGGAVVSDRGLRLSWPAEMLDRKRRGAIQILATGDDNIYLTYSKGVRDDRTLIEVPRMDPWREKDQLTQDGTWMFWGLLHEDKHVENGLKMVGLVKVALVDEVVTLGHELSEMKRMGENGEYYAWRWGLFNRLVKEANGQNGALDHSCVHEVNRLADGLLRLPEAQRREVISVICKI